MAAPASRFRYKDTPAFNGPHGRQHGLYVPPRELVGLPAAAFRAYRVTTSDVGFPDRIAVAVYGPGSEDLWWAVLWPNAIADPDAEMYPGQVLRIPPREALLRFQGRPGAYRQ